MTAVLEKDAEGGSPIRATSVPGGFELSFDYTHADWREIEETTGPLPDLAFLVSVDEAARSYAVVPGPPTGPVERVRGVGLRFWKGTGPLTLRLKRAGLLWMVRLMLARAGRPLGLSEAGGARRRRMLKLAGVCAVAVPVLVVVAVVLLVVR